MSFRVTPEFKAQIERCAEQSGRSLSQECELRLEQSIHNERVLEEALEMICGGPLNAELALIFGKILRSADQVAWIHNKRGWPEHRPALDRIIKTINDVVIAAFVGGELTSEDNPHFWDRQVRGPVLELQTPVARPRLKRLGKSGAGLIRLARKYWSLTRKAAIENP
jgi:hypothetical protein